ncbi:MAG: MotA/TolQ/ExbB proton channel family protein [Marinoscillum sp.]
MFDLFMMGGPLFMGTITLILLAGLTVAVKSLLSVINSNNEDGANQATYRLLGYVRSIGLLCLVTGFLGQMVGLYSAFEAIEEVGPVSPALLAGGLKVSSITPIYGMLCFVICYLSYFGISMLIKKRT